MKKKKDLIIGFILGGIVFGSGVLAYSYYANQVSYTTNKNSNVDNVQKAIDDLYGKIPTGPTYEAAPSGATYKGIVYLDPTDLSKTCTATDAANNVNSNGTPTEIKTGCMKWYIYSEDKTNNTYTMILDHNTTAKVQWYTSNSNVTYASSLVKPYVDALTSTNKWKVNPRLISANEIKTITGNTAFDLETASWYCFGSNTKDYPSSEPYCNKDTNKKYAWLYDYLNDGITYGANYNDNNTYALTNNTATTGGTYGYWTSDTVGTAGSGSRVWYVYRRGALNDASASGAGSGVRPVITISKAIIR